MAAAYLLTAALPAQRINSTCRVGASHIAGAAHWYWKKGGHSRCAPLPQHRAQISLEAYITCCRGVRGQGYGRLYPLLPAVYLWHGYGA